ncbi:MAG: hypothetical protein ACP5L5_08075 [Vulcanisaeta sp.]|uniref:hypothetical protein n=1 Tax=Vulcanisaeta sp. TaxID=2020871 RepID=UPI003D0A7D46
MLREDEEFRLAVIGLLGITDIQSSIKQLVSAVNELTRTVQRLAEGQEKLWEEDRRIYENIERLWQENNRLWREVRLLRRDVGAIRRTLDNLTASIEEEANDVITHLLKGRGVDIRTNRVVLDSRFEFDVYGTNGQLTIVGEAKTRVGPRLIARFDERIGEVLRLFPDKFPGRVIKVIYCLRAMPGTVEEGYLAY